MTLDDRLKAFGVSGYCLWAGAGVPIHLACAAGQKVAGWKDLVELLEKDAGLPPPPEKLLTFDERLDLVLRRMSRFPFQKRIRQVVYGELCKALVQLGRDAAKNEDDPIPRQVRQLARLGVRANPIVNFNLEGATTRLISGGGGGGHVKFFQPPVVGTTSTKSYDHVYGRAPFVRQVFHPHGAITANGICVLTATEYRSMHGTLAFQLASHAAFDNLLLIVGMSLEDKYLREQLSRFRDQIGHVVWVCSRAPDDMETERWAAASRIEILLVDSWSEFWESAGRAFPKEDNCSLATNWMVAFQGALGEVEGYAGGRSAISTIRKNGPVEDVAAYQVFLANCGLDIPHPNEEAACSPQGPRDLAVEGALTKYIERESKDLGRPT